MGFVVGVYFDVLVGDLFFFEDGPGALDEGAAFEVLACLVVVGRGGSAVGGLFLGLLSVPFYALETGERNVLTTSLSRA